MLWVDLELLEFFLPLVLCIEFGDTVTQDSASIIYIYINCQLVSISGPFLSMVLLVVLILDM